MTGYQLSARAAAMEQQWSTARSERKEIVSGWVDGTASTANRDDFETNRITTARFYDRMAAGDGSAEGLATAGACVSFWAGNIAGLPLHIVREVDGIDEVYADHPLYGLLHDDPNYDQSAFDFWEYMVESIEWRGNAYARINRRSSGEITSLVPLHPDCVRASRLASGDIQYEYTENGRTSKVGNREMLHIRGRGGDPVGGASTIATYRRALRLAVATEASADAIFANGIRSSGVLKSDKPLNADQRTEAEAMIHEKMAGAANAGKPMLLDSHLSFEKISIDPVDAELVTSRQLGMTIICQIFEVDPHMVGITTGNTTLGSSIAEQTLSLVKFRMHKRLRRIESALGKQLLTIDERRRGVKMRFNLEGFLRADSLGRGRFYQLMKPFLTINEVRATEGKRPVPGGDVLYRQQQDLPLGSRSDDNSRPEGDQ